MTTPLLMKRSGECDATILTDYLTNRNSNMVFIFYEGKDDPKFYHQHIRIFLKKCSKIKMFMTFPLFHSLNKNKVMIIKL